MKKYSNYFILFALLCIGVMFKDSIHISTNLLSLFASKDAREKLVIADKLGYSKELLVIVKGFDTSSKNKLREIVQKLQKVDGIVFVGSSLVPSMEVQNYYKVYYPILATFNDKNQTSKTIKESLEKLYDAQFTNVFYTAIDKNDPLSLFNLQNANSIDVSHRGEFIRLGDYGYLIRASTSVSASQMDKAKVLYKDVHSILDSAGSSQSQGVATHSSNTSLTTPRRCCPCCLLAAMHDQRSHIPSLCIAAQALAAPLTHRLTWHDAEDVLPQVELPQAERQQPHD